MAGSSGAGPRGPGRAAQRAVHHRGVRRHLYRAGGRSRRAGQFWQYRHRSSSGVVEECQFARADACRGCDSRAEVGKPPPVWPQEQSILTVLPTRSPVSTMEPRPTLNYHPKWITRSGQVRYRDGRSSRTGIEGPVIETSVVRTTGSVRIVEWPREEREMGR